ncbi:hypothetical protein TTHT_1645 [Thermotomaculum hydrothermale]|uniref:Uncharacterized protein n=1 Tax=Thermotomaculum hydrothermale TaxID=981385 RepID=A0A7R6SYX4_9BACT|nr:hypothetical protein [Thermotomaculum hydrothermale]BBB33130.1 hypothetical protein TTHT_1645 [Thermotomaculum hydrothermale]
MKYLKYIWKNKQTAILLYLEDFIMFLLVFIPIFTTIKSSARRNYYSINFTVDYVADILPKMRGIGAYAVIIAILLLVYFIVRILLLSGIFSKLIDENVNCLKKSPENFWRFLGLFFIYIIIFGVLSGIIGFPLKKMMDNTVNVKTAYILQHIKLVLTLLIGLIISLFHNAARVKTVMENRFKAFSKPERVLPFFGYQIVEGIITFIGLLITYKIFILNGWLAIIFAFILFQLTIFLKILFKLSSYKSLT